MKKRNDELREKSKRFDKGYDLINSCLKKVEITQDKLAERAPELVHE